MSLMPWTIKDAQGCFMVIAFINYFLYLHLRKNLISNRMKTETDESKYFVAPHRLVEIEEERKHIENIFYARFNYFILFFTLFLSIEVAIFFEQLAVF